MFFANVLYIVRDKEAHWCKSFFDRLKEKTESIL